MIPPRRSGPATDPALLDGVLGAAAMLRAIRALVAELAAEGGESGEGGGEPADGEVVDVVLGLAALADVVTRRLAEDGDRPGPGDGGDERDRGEDGGGGDDGARARIELAVGELLR